MRYPPLAVAVAGALALAATIDLKGNGHSSDAPTRFAAVDYASCAGGFALVFLAMSAIRVSRDAIARMGRDAEASAGGLRSELPLVDSRDDRFNRVAVARRLARLLNRQFGHDIGIAITGAFGSGKTTLVNFVESELRQLPQSTRVWLCRVSCWGFDDSRAALQHTLAAMVDCLERQVDCAAVRGLPVAYQQAFSAASTGWLSSILPVALVQDPNPTQQLRRLTPLLRAIDARLVVVIEDVDRQESSDFDPTHIERLLYSLKGVSGVSFIVCTSSQEGKA
jgi:hypothetical protein